MATTKPGPRIAARHPDRKLTAIKILPAELAEIDKRAKRLGLTRTDFMVRKALDKAVGDEGHTERIAELEERITRLERVTFGG
jgi:uncharacterized protein (DUF1778 family)